MKKIFVLFVIGLSIISCTSNDNDPSSDPIIGKWQLHQTIEDGTDTTTDCLKKSRLEFLVNNTFSGFYNGDCERENVNGTWENNGNNSYTNTQNRESSTIDLEFSNNNKTFQYTDTDTFNGQTSTYTEVWKKI